MQIAGCRARNVAFRGHPSPGDPAATAECRDGDLPANALKRGRRRSPPEQGGQRCHRVIQDSASCANYTH
eukprot:1586121-Pyramimonas_sp.AAC.1